MTGQDAVTSAQAFHERLALDGVIFTKLDGDSRGGAIVSLRHLLGKPIKFVGVGEKLTRFKNFSRIVMRAASWAWVTFCRWSKKPSLQSMTKKPLNSKRNLLKINLIWRFC